jgi:hypothetical protein
VTGSGNSGFDHDVDGYPALYFSTTSTVQVPLLLVAGATTETGLVSSGSQIFPANIVQFYAPGRGISCASSDNNYYGVDSPGWIRNHCSGTSLCKYLFPSRPSFAAYQT